MPIKMDATLKKFIGQCLRGDAEAQRQLFEQYKTWLFPICLRYARDRPEAQDMLQEAFLFIFRDLGQYKGDGALGAWLQRVTVRVALQSLRRKNPLRFAENYDDLPPDTYDFTPDTELNSEAILLMVQQLPPGYRAVFNLRCMEGFEYPEIAAELGIAESSVRSQYARACKQLRGMVERILVLV
jgi:RNA polymerase sigma-70 factor (ECF subfamily)